MKFRSYQGWGHGISGQILGQTLDPWLYGGDRMRKELLKYNRKRIPESDKWRIGYLEKLLTQRLIMHYEMEDLDTVTNIIESLVIN